MDLVPGIIIEVAFHQDKGKKIASKIDIENGENEGTEKQKDK